MPIHTGRALKVLLIHDADFPVVAYGGTERVVWWLAKGLSELGEDVTVGCRPGSRIPFAKTVFPDFAKPLEPQVRGYDVHHLFNTPSETPSVPYVVTIEGNGKPGETFLPNTVFVSRNHAERHGSSVFVHNGIDPDEYEFRRDKEDYLVFLAKASWRVKNVSGAIRIVKKAGVPLRILGGTRWWANPFSAVKWEGMIGGEKKRKLIAGSKGLLFPVLWHEPFGIAVIEALASGSPVLATPFGSLPELVTPDVGRLCSSEAEFGEAIASLGVFDPDACRRRAVENFHYRSMAEKYLALYRRVASGESLNPGPVRGASRDPEHGCGLGAHTG